LHSTAIRGKLSAMAAFMVSSRAARFLVLSLLLGLMAFVFAGCASHESEGDPIENKVFYKGWGWHKSE
jgi:hypothetical protein